MGNAKVCLCGHNTTDHKYQYGKEKLWGHCDWYNCECKEFVFIHESPAKNYRFNEDTGEPMTLKIPKLPRTFKIGELTEDGTLPEVDHMRWLRFKNKKKIYNNGEYP